MAKFCEPHMLLYPELRKMMDEAGIPYLLIETEHEGLPMESIRTRVEALVERLPRTRAAERSPNRLTSAPGPDRGPGSLRTTTGSDRSRGWPHRTGGQMIADYWDNIFTAPERGKKVVWYNGGALNPIFQAAGLDWCHGEAFAARLAALHLEGPPAGRAPSTATSTSCAPTRAPTWDAPC